MTSFQSGFNGNASTLFKRPVVRRYYFLQMLLVVLAAIVLFSIVATAQLLTDTPGPQDASSKSRQAGGAGVYANKIPPEKQTSVRIKCVRVLTNGDGNDHYVSNRPPLASNPLIKLPPGAILPGGWLRVWLDLERDGMVGRLDEVSSKVRMEGNPWVDPHAKDNFVYEFVPYWLRGYGSLGYVTANDELIRNADKWRRAVLEHQQDDGYFGPRKHKNLPDLWPNMVMLNCLESYYEASHDERVIPFMLKFFRYVDSLPQERIFGRAPAWVQTRGGDLLQSIIWTYNRTGDKWLLALAEKVHRNTYNWSLGIYATLAAEGITNYAGCPGAHGVNLAQGFREPAQYFQLTRDRNHLEVTETFWQDIRETFGQFAGGLWAADDWWRPGFSGPRHGIETCAVIEFMRSAEILIGITGNPAWADRCEDVAFNTLPAALMPDFRGLLYCSAPNCVQLDHKDKRPISAGGGSMFLYSPHSKHFCCQHNVAMGWPYFAEHLWYATPGNGLAAVMYSNSTVRAKVGNGTMILVEQVTDYPFDDIVRFKLQTPKAVSFPFVLRIPSWCQKPAIVVNDRSVSIPLESGSFVVIDRTWQDGDGVVLHLPMGLSVKRWGNNRNSVSLSRGPLTYSLKITERWERYAGNVKPQGTDQWPEWEVFPDSAWNYVLELDPAHLLANFDVRKKEMPSGQVFEPDRVPIEIVAKGRILPAWKREKGMVGSLPQSPLLPPAGPTDSITLIPMGCARLRISSFPWYDGRSRPVRWFSYGVPPPPGWMKQKAP